MVVLTTLNLAPRSFSVIHFGGNRKPVYDFIQAVNSSFQARSQRGVLGVETPQKSLHKKFGSTFLLKG